MAFIQYLLVRWAKRKIRGYIMWKFAGEVFKGAVRHALTGVGLVAVNAGYASEDELTSAIGAAGVLAGFAWSVFRKWRRA